MALSVYVHIPYCLQRCRYCDFTTFEASQILPPDQYVQMVLKEIRSRHQSMPTRELSTIYFGGGTPSLISSDLIVSILNELANAGFHWKSSAEITIEINPATVDERKLEAYITNGINRMSVGAQTFNDALLQMCGRRHSAADTVNTLRLLKSYGLNYSFDLLFALPGQTLAQVCEDVEQALEFDPAHLSAYCLTVPDTHPMALGRAPEDEQVQMFQEIEARLGRRGIQKYEISNFAKIGFESKHNQAYWSDRDYWGLGLSSHSYLKNTRYGSRFWNAKDFNTYESQLAKSLENWPAEQIEHLKEHEAMTDFCHMYLRTSQGLHFDDLRSKFGRQNPIETRLKSLLDQRLLESTETGVKLSEKGQLLSNQVFADLTFLADDLTKTDDHPYSDSRT